MRIHLRPEYHFTQKSIKGNANILQKVDEKYNTLLRKVKTLQIPSIDSSSVLDSTEAKAKAAHSGAKWVKIRKNFGMFKIS